MLEIYFDFHDLFVESKQAWLAALKEGGASEKCLEDYCKGMSRHILCAKYGIDYETLEEQYREKLQPISAHIQFARMLSEHVDIYVLSSARRSRLLSDMAKFGLNDLFAKVYSKDEVTSKLEFLLERAKKVEWVVYFNHEHNNILEIGNVIEIPIDFYVDRSESLHASFDEHARNKLLYHELSEYYMLSIANDTKTEALFLNDVFLRQSITTEKRLLDCCCGVGRHSYLMAQMGYMVDGIDFSADQIRNAERIHQHPNIRYHVMDARDMRLEEKYDMAICMWTTYNYMSTDEELRAFFTNIWQRLLPGGLLILDAKNIPAQEPKRVYIRSSNDEHGTSITLLVNKDIVANTQNSEYLYFIRQGNRQSFYLDYEHVRFYTLDELQNIAGDMFDIVSLYGDFDKQPYEEENSERFIVVLRSRACHL